MHTTPPPHPTTLPQSVTQPAQPQPTQRPQQPQPAPPRFGGLDGLRAIAVTMVLVYHFFPSALPGGFLGVDVFFVISGFLITSLLLREHHVRGRIRLRAFWGRRVRRLLPALVVALLVSTTAALFVGGDVLVGIGAQLFGSLFFVSNWVFIGRGTDYFARDTPELFRNTWSLSIEEQFYVFLPFLLIVALVGESRFWRAMPFLTLTLGSAAAMAVLAAEGANPTRVYFGSDTHTFGLFMGVSLAIFLAPNKRGAGGSTLTAPPFRAQQPVTLLAAATGLGILGWLAFTLREGSPESFQFGFQLASLAALAIVWAITRPGAVVGRLLDAAPLRWIGERSYGIYLWHWPVLVLVMAPQFPWAQQADSRWIGGTLALLITLPLAMLSYRYVEQPVRRAGLRASLGTLLRPRRLPRQRRALATAAYALVLVTVPAIVLAIAVAPQQTSAAASVARGQEALERLRAEQSGGSTSETSETSGGGATTDAAGADDQQPPHTDAAAPGALASPITGTEVFAIGDSVMLASVVELAAMLPGIAIDADVSRSFSFGVGMLTEQAVAVGLRPVLVVGLATNGPVTAADLEALRAATSGCRIVLVNAHGDRWWIPEGNQALADFAAATPGVVLADWTGAIAPYPESLAEDGIHPGTSGAAIYAQAVQQALEALRQPAEQLP